MRIILLTFLIFILSASYAHSDLISSVNKDNIHLKYKTGFLEFEIGNRLNILVDLASKLLKSKNYNTEELYINFIHGGSSFYALSYGDFTYWEIEKNKVVEDIKGTGLRLMIRDGDFDIRQLLNLINSAIVNVDYIKTHQKQLLVDLRHTSVDGVAQFDTLFSVPSQTVKTFLSSTDQTVDKLVQTKTYNNNELPFGYAINYYFQNNKFHFYYKREPEEEWDENLRKYVISKVYEEEDILVVDNILEIFGGSNDGQFVFTNDSIFYYIPQRNWNDKPPIKSAGPFKVDSIIRGRQPVLKYYHENSPIKRFTLFFYQRGKNKKAIFFPDSNIVISNFDKIEDDFINALLTKPPKVTQKKKTYTTIISLLIILSISVIINISQTAG